MCAGLGAVPASDPDTGCGVVLDSDPHACLASSPSLGVSEEGCCGASDGKFNEDITSSIRLVLCL